MKLFRRRKKYTQCSSCGVDIYNRYGWTPGRPVLCCDCMDRASRDMLAFVYRVFDARDKEATR